MRYKKNALPPEAVNFSATIQHLFFLLFSILTNIVGPSINFRFHLLHFLLPNFAGVGTLQKLDGTQMACDNVPSTLAGGIPSGALTNDQMMAMNRPPPPQHTKNLLHMAGN